MLLTHQPNGWPKILQSMVETFTEYSIFPKVSINYGEGKCYENLKASSLYYLYIIIFLLRIAYKE